MYKLAFFCIPAHGHTNPTLEVVRELVRRGHQVRYYSYEMMRGKIEGAGAQFIPCDQYDIQMNLTPEDADRVGQDIAFSIELLVNTTLALDEAILSDMRAWGPDCIVADSMATWGRLAALKLGVPLVSSTTTFAFNRHAAKVLDQGIGQLLKLLPAMGKANRSVKRLRAKGYPVKNVLSVISNDNDTNTIVYTSPEFQPCADTFSDRYAFVGPSIRPVEALPRQGDRKQVYISLGTVANHNDGFYRRCIQAFRQAPYRVVMSVGERTDLAQLGALPAHISAAATVAQLAVLQQTDVFLTHCGMNSVNEALYHQVPLVLFPQTSEQRGVARRVQQLGAGLWLEEDSPQAIRAAVDRVLEEDSFRQQAARIAQSFRRCGGAGAAADKIEATAREGGKPQE